MALFLPLPSLHNPHPHPQFTTTSAGLGKSHNCRHDGLQPALDVATSAKDLFQAPEAWMLHQKLDQESVDFVQSVRAMLVFDCVGHCNQDLIDKIFCTRRVLVRGRDPFASAQDRTTQR